MQPVKVSHNIIPRAPFPSNGAALCPASPASLRRAFRRHSTPVSQISTSAPLAEFTSSLPVASPSSLRRPSTPTCLGIGLDIAQPEALGECEFAPPTPTNSSRQTPNTRRIMMPRSSHSRRQHILEARYAEEVDTVSSAPLELTERPSTAIGINVTSELHRPTRSMPNGVEGLVLQNELPSSSQFMPVRSKPQVAALNVDVVQMPAASMWTANGLSTPKNSDRRDLQGSVELNMPLFRGSAIAVDARQGYATRGVAPTIATSFMPMGYSRSEPSREPVPLAPATPSSLSGRVQAPNIDSTSTEVSSSSFASPTEYSPPMLSTPKNSERLNATGGLRVMMPRSNRSIRNSLLQASLDGSTADLS